MFGCSRIYRRKKFLPLSALYFYTQASFFLVKFVKPWTGKREGSGGENAGMWGSDITGRYITDSQVHCQARQASVLPTSELFFPPLECVWIAGIGQRNIECHISLVFHKDKT